MREWRGRVWASVGAAGMAPKLALAAPAAGGMPWDTPLQNILANVTGPTAGVVVILAVALFCASLMFGAAGGLMQWAMGIILGCSILIAANTFILPFFGG